MGSSISSILWRRLDQPGHDTARLIELADGAVIEGSAVFSESGRPTRLDYRITCDAAWRTVSARVTGWLDTTAVDVDIVVEAAREWRLNGRSCVEVHGCEDVDLSFSPVTNLLPIRRTRLDIGGRAAVRAAWLRFPDPQLEPLEQTYERIDDRRYRYTSENGGFVAILETGAAGFVTRYGDLWQIESRD